MLSPEPKKSPKRSLNKPVTRPLKQVLAHRMSKLIEQPSLKPTNLQQCLINQVVKQANQVIYKMDLPLEKRNIKI